VPADHPSLPGHFPGNPVVPGVLLLDAILSRLEQATGCRAVRLQQVKFLAVLRPGEHALTRCAVDGDTATFRAFTRWGTATMPLASGTIALAPNATTPAA
jgi:3-hydroxymyristoyl/3-hydroxydecanoyl-(acyl carrier protein) dehydratase